MSPLITITRFIIVALWTTIAFESVAQEDAFTLSNTEISVILDGLDTLSGDKNYHVLLKSEDTVTFQVYIWINDKLGETMFKEASMNICRLYTFRQSLVYVYEYRQCNGSISPKFLRNNSSDPYAYLTESPFYVENGFHQSLLVERTGSNLKLTELEIIDESGIDQDIIDTSEYEYR